MIILEGKELTRRYIRGKYGTDALSQVSFNLEKGEILGIVGESGSGKSTLLRLISGLEAPDSGTLALMGTPLSTVRSREEYRHIQMVFQDAAGSFHPRRRIAVSIRESVRNLTGREPDLPALCAMVGLAPELLDRYPRELSGGQCQRLAIARALGAEPEVLLCDEITSALDVSTQAQILNLLADLCRSRDLSVILVSHDLAVVSCLCTRVMVLRGGRVVEEGPVREILEHPREEYTKQLRASVLER